MTATSVRDPAAGIAIGRRAGQDPAASRRGLRTSDEPVQLARPTIEWRGRRGDGGTRNEKRDRQNDFLHCFLLYSQDVHRDSYLRISESILVWNDDSLKKCIEDQSETDGHWHDF